MQNELSKELHSIVEHHGFTNPYESPITLDQLLDRKFDTKKNSIIGSGLLHRGAYLVLGGPPKTYKSFIAKSMCYHLATGTSLFSVSRSLRESQREETFPIATSQRVLLLEQEIGEFDLQARFRQMISGLGSAERTLCREKIFIHSCDHDMQLDTEVGQKHIARLVEDVRPDVVVLDPLIEFHSGDENSARDMAKALHGLDWLRERYGFATILVHHISKPQKDSARSGPDNLRGSSVIYGKGDSFLMVRPERKRGDGCIRVDFTLRRGRPIGSIYLRVDTGTLRTEFLGWINGQSEQGAGFSTPSL